MSHITAWILWGIMQAGYLLLQANSLVHATAYSPQDLPSTAPCPNADDIYPCLCFFDEFFNLDMDCSGIATDLQLVKVFSAPFPVKNFRNFTIQNNSGLKKLSEGDLADISFQQIYITHTTLYKLESRSLAGSFSTLHDIRLIDNKITAFPFEDLPLFANLEVLYLDENAIEGFPDLASPTLRELRLNHNPINSIPEDGLQMLPALESIRIINCGLTELKSGTFTGLESLHDVNMCYNYVTSIPHNTFDLLGSNPGVCLHHNFINSIAFTAFSGFVHAINLRSNALETLDEKVHRPLLEQGTIIYLADNPFTCGCDVAWVVLNTTLMESLLKVDNVTCADGTKFSDLDPAYYESICSSLEEDDSY